MAIKKVLVIDDSENEYFILKGLFSGKEANQYELEWVGDETKAIKLISQSCHDVYLVDYKLKGITGLDLIRRGKKEGNSGVFILLTGFDQNSVDNEALELGVDDYIIKKDLTYSLIDKSIRYSLERKRSERAFVEQQVKMLNSLKLSMLGELVSGVAHELNNPLSLITIISSNLRKIIEKDKFSKQDLVVLMNKLERAILRTRQIARSLNRYSRNSEEDPFEEVNLSDLVEEALQICMGKIRSRRVHLVFDSENKENDGLVKVRPGELIQVLVNLLNNAVEAISEQKEPWIKVDYKIGNNGEASLIITDSGDGIDADLKKEIYMPFFTTKQGRGGTGLGLSVSKSIIDAHGGTMSFTESKMGNTMVVIKLPAQRGELKKGKVIIVNQDKELRSLLKSVLEEKNCNVLEFSYLDEIWELDLSNSKIVYDSDGCDIVQVVNKFESMSLNSRIAYILPSGSLAHLERGSNDLNLFYRPFDTDRLMNFCMGN